MAASAGTAAGCVVLPPSAAVSRRGRTHGYDCGCCAGACCMLCRLAHEGGAGRWDLGCAHAGRQFWSCSGARRAAAPLLPAPGHASRAAAGAVERHG